MARVSETTSLAQNVLQDAAGWYARNALPRGFRSVHPSVIAVAQRLCAGDWQRCVVDDDGSVVVYNQRAWAVTHSE